MSRWGLIRLSYKKINDAQGIRKSCIAWNTHIMNGSTMDTCMEHKHRVQYKPAKPQKRIHQPFLHILSIYHLYMSSYEEEDRTFFLSIDLSSLSLWPSVYPRLHFFRSSSLSLNFVSLYFLFRRSPFFLLFLGFPLIFLFLVFFF